jgi:hypothetical protein
VPHELKARRVITVIPSSRATTSPEACQEAPREYSGFPLRFTSQEQPSAWHLPTVRHSILGTGFYTILKRCGKRAEWDTARTVKLFTARHTRAYKPYLQNQEGPMKCRWLGVIVLRPATVETTMFPSR